MKRSQKKYYKLMVQAEQQSIWKYEMAVNIIKNLTLAFATQRLKLLEEKDAKWTAKDAVAGGIAEKDVAEELKKLKFDIEREKSIVKDAKERIDETIEMIKVTSGKIEFMQSVINNN